jgi:hypothetical protein
MISAEVPPRGMGDSLCSFKAKPKMQHWNYEVGEEKTNPITKVNPATYTILEEGHLEASTSPFNILINSLQENRSI